MNTANISGGIGVFGRKDGLVEGNAHMHSCGGGATAMLVPASRSSDPMTQMRLNFLLNDASEDVDGQETQDRDVPQDSTPLPSPTTELYPVTVNAVSPFNCVKCAFTAESKLKLRYHMATEHGEAYFSCTDCKIAFLRKYDLRKHVSSVHERSRPYACQQCASSFFLRKDLKKHVASVHEQKKPYVCTVCKYAFGKKEHMVRHYRLTHEQRRPFLCTTCNISFGTKQNLQEHMRSRTHQLEVFALEAARQDVTGPRVQADP